MSTDTKPTEHGQEEGNPLVEVMEKNVRAIVRMSTVLTRLSRRLTVIEAKLDMGDEKRAVALDEEDTNVDGEPLREPADPDEQPPFAMGSDGRAILHLDYLEDEDVAAYPHFVGAILSETETAELLTFLADGASDAAGRLGGFIRKTRKGGEGEGGAPC